jgi:uncharacterized protein
MGGPRVAHLWRHPIKGHGVEAVTRATLAAGRTMPGDRVWAIATEAARVAPGDASWAPCANFSRGAKSPALMAIRARTDEATGRIRLTHPDRPPLEVDPDDPADQARLIDWAATLADRVHARPAFVVRADRGMTDSAFPSIALLNLASLRALSAAAGRPLAMERFRGNIWLDGLAPWAECDWIGREIAVGAARLRVVARITRCVATSADPRTGRPSVDVLRLLESGWGHRDFGVYAEVVGGGPVAVGDPIALLEPAAP